MQAAWARLAVTSTLLAVSGVLIVVASAQRWGCRIGVFDAANDECWLREDNLYDYINPSGEWVPLGTEAELHGVGMLIFAVAVLLLPGVLAGRHPGRMMTITAIPVSASVVVVALPTLLSGLKGEAVSLPQTWLFEEVSVLYLLGLPALLIISAMRATPGPPRVEVARWAVVVSLIAANNVVITMSLAMAILMYSGYDAIPWAEGVGGVLLIGASIVLWLTVDRAPAPDADTADGQTPASVTGAP